MAAVDRLAEALANKQLETDNRLQSAGFADLLLALAAQLRDVDQTLLVPTGENEPYSVEDLRERLGEGWEPKYVFFWSHMAKDRALGRECLSQWYPATFVVDGLLFRTAEHFMMHRKARLFGDEHAAELILDADHPGEAKSLGRMVRDFDEDLWEQKRFEIVVAGSIAKFGQNHEPGAFLLGTSSRVLVEASPQDRIWGIGLADKDRDARRPERWRGLNLLGFALMKARAELAAANVSA